MIVVLLLSVVAVVFALLHTQQVLGSIKRHQQESKHIIARIHEFYSLYSNQNWQGCFNTLDPKLSGKIKFPEYSQNMSLFYRAYGSVKIIDVEITGLHLDAPPNMLNETNFAYANVTWKEDKNNISHTFKERWVKAQDGNWYTRKAGLI